MTKKISNETRRIRKKRYKKLHVIELRDLDKKKQ